MILDFILTQRGQKKKRHIFVNWWILSLTLLVQHFQMNRADGAWKIGKVVAD